MLIKIIIIVATVSIAVWGWGAIQRQVERDKRDLLDNWARDYERRKGIR